MVTALAFSAALGAVISGGEDGTVRLRWVSARCGTTKTEADRGSTAVCGKGHLCHRDCLGLPCKHSYRGVGTSLMRAILALQKHVLLLFTR